MASVAEDRRQGEDNIELAGTRYTDAKERASSESSASEGVGYPLISSDGPAEGRAAETDDALQRASRWFGKLPLAVLILFCVVVAVALALLVVSLRNIDGSKQDHYWPGFDKIESIQAFGDSWTDSHFKPWEGQPSRENPLGNPRLPGGTSSNGYNYVGYLATKYNQSFVKAYDYALSGAVVNTTIIPAFVNWLDLVHEAKDRFLGFYANSTTPDGPLHPVGWDSKTSLFTFFFGINDVAAANKSDLPWDALFASYENIIDSLYDVGARNFVLMNVPPIDRAPAITKVNDTQYEIDIRDALASYNARFPAMANSLRLKHKDATVFEFDTWSLFTKIMDDPQTVPETRVYKDVTHACDLWEKLPFGTVPTAEQVEHCGGFTIEESLWVNNFHVSWPAHDAIAAELHRMLTAKK